MTEKMKTVLVGTNYDTYIYMEYAAYLKILRYSKAGSIDGSRGVFLGKIEDGAVYIYEALEAMYFGDEGLEAPSFTGQSWQRITEEIKENHKDLRILGQYSTHPDVKPAEMDMSMQEGFFDSMSDLLFVFDPVENTSEIYKYSDKKYTAVKGIKLFDKYDNELDMRIAESIMRPINREYELRTKLLNKFSKKLKEKNRVYMGIFAVLFLVIIYLTFQTVELGGRCKTMEKQINDLQWVSAQQEEQIKELTEPEPTATPKANKKTTR